MERRLVRTAMRLNHCLKKLLAWGLIERVGDEMRCIHDYEVDKVNGACFVESGIEPVAVNVAWGCAELEP